jgi:hypothetical protein
MRFKKTKVMLCKTLTRTVLTYGSETWTLSKNSENTLSTFERKILRRIYGSVQDNGQWRIRYNKELCELYGEPDLVTGKGKAVPLYVMEALGGRGDTTPTHSRPRH